MIAREVPLDNAIANCLRMLGTKIGGRRHRLRNLAEHFQRLLTHRDIEFVDRVLRVGRNAECFEDALDVIGKRHD